MLRPHRASLCSFAAAGVLLSLTGISSAQQLTSNQVQDIIRRAVARADQLGFNATISVVDREGNILGCVRMINNTGGRTSPITSVIRGGGRGGLEISPAFPTGVPIPTSITATSKAGTAAFLSSRGNAFSTRTAAFIVQPNFPPNIKNQASGPLFGVQFSSLPTSDFNRLPLGLSADSGGIPLYDPAGNCIGGIGVETNDTPTAATGTYGIDTTRASGVPSTEELIALAGQAGFAAPRNIQGSEILVNSIRFPFIYANPPRQTAAPNIDLTNAALFTILFPFRAAQPSQYVSVPLINPVSNQPITYNGVQGATVAAFNQAGVFTPIAGGTFGGQNLTVADVRTIIGNAHKVNSRLRAMIRRDRPQISQVNVSVVDRDGTILGYYRSPDAPVFGMDVSLQKARSAAFLSRPDAGSILTALEPAFPLANGPNYFNKYVIASAGRGVPLNGSIALAERSIGFIARPLFPDGLANTPPGPLSTFGPLGNSGTSNRFSVFNTGLQTDLFVTNIVAFLTAYGAGGGANEADNLQAFDANRGVRDAAGGFLTNRPLGAASPNVPARATVGEPDTAPPDGLPGRTLANGLQIFPGGVPLYKNGVLVGAIGVSGDGIEQDDYVAFEGSVGFRALPTGVFRADFIFVGPGLRLPYIKLPRNPFAGL